MVPAAPAGSGRHGETGHTCHPLRHSYENRRHPLDLPVSSFRRKPESRGVAGVARTAPKRFHQSTPFFIPWCAGTSRRERFVRKIDSLNPIRHLYAAIGLNNVPIVGCGRGECSAGACPPLGSAWSVAESAAPIRCTNSLLRVFIPWCAGTSRHERLVRRLISVPGLPRQPAGARTIPPCRRTHRDSPPFSSTSTASSGRGQPRYRAQSMPSGASGKMASRCDSSPIPAPRVAGLSAAS